MQGVVLKVTCTSLIGKYSQQVALPLRSTLHIRGRARASGRVADRGSGGSCTVGTGIHCVTYIMLPLHRSCVAARQCI